MQSLHKTNKATFSRGRISAVKIEQNMRKRAPVPTNLRLYHYAGNNPITYTDPNGMESFKYEQYLIDFMNAEIVL